MTRYNQHHQQSNSEVNSCFSNLARSQILLKNHNKDECDFENKFQPNFEQRQINVSNKIRQSHEQLVFKQKSKEVSLGPSDRNKVKESLKSSSRYLSVGYNQMNQVNSNQFNHEEEYTGVFSNREDSGPHASKNTFKKSDASSFTQASEEFGNTKNSNETAEGTKATRIRIGEREKRR